MPRGSILDGKGIDNIGKGGRSYCTGWGDILGPQTRILEKKHVELSLLFFKRALFLWIQPLLEQRLLQWWLKLHGVGLYPQSWIWKRKSKKTDSWDEITGWTQLSVINHQSIYKNSWRRLDLGDGTACLCEAMDTLHCWWHLRTQQSCRTHEWRMA